MNTISSSEASRADELITKFSPYLHELRKRVLITLSVFVVTAFIGLFYNETIIKFLVDVLSLHGVNIVFTSPFQFINLAISCALATGVVFTFPLVVFHVISFLRPALRRKELRTILKCVPIVLGLFVAGFLFGGIVMKWQIEVFLAKSVSLGIGNVLDITQLMSTVVLVSVIMGIAFQFPLVILLMVYLDVVKRAQLSKQRKWVYVGAFMFAILLPLDSIIADILLALPLVVLFEITIFISHIWERQRKNITFG